MERYSEVGEVYGPALQHFVVCWKPGWVRDSEWKISMFFPWWFPQGGSGFFHPAAGAASLEHRLQRKCRCDAICGCKTALYILYAHIYAQYLLFFIYSPLEQPEFVTMQIKIFRKHSAEVLRYGRVLLSVSLLDWVTLKTIISLWCFKLCDGIVFTRQR